MLSYVNWVSDQRPESVTRLRPLEVGSLNQAETEKSFQDEINVTLGNTDPSTLDSDTIASTIRTVTVDAAQKVIPAKSKPFFCRNTIFRLNPY